MSPAPSRSPEGARRPDAGLPAPLTAWAAHVLGAEGFTVARHHSLLMARLDALSDGGIDRLMVLMPPGSAKSTYCILNMLLGSLAAMATSVVSYWVGSSAGSARKDDHIARLTAKSNG